MPKTRKGESEAPGEVTRDPRTAGVEEANLAEEGPEIAHESTTEAGAREVGVEFAGAQAAEQLSEFISQTVGDAEGEGDSELEALGLEPSTKKEGDYSEFTDDGDDGGGFVSMEERLAAVAPGEFVPGLTPGVTTPPSSGGKDAGSAASTFDSGSGGGQQSATSSGGGAYASRSAEGSSSGSGDDATSHSGGGGPLDPGVDVQDPLKSYAEGDPTSWSVVDPKASRYDDVDGDSGPVPGGGRSVAADRQTASGHPAAYNVFWKDGEVKNYNTTVGKGETILGVEVGNIRHEKEQTKRAEEVQQQKEVGGTGGSAPGSGGSGSGLPTEPVTYRNEEAGITVTHTVSGTTVVDENNGTITFLNKKTGSTVTQDLNTGKVINSTEPLEQPPDPEGPQRVPLDEKLNDPLFQQYQQSKNAGGGGDGATDPSKTDDVVVGTGSFTAAELSRAEHDMRVRQFGQPAGEDFGGEPREGTIEHPDAGVIDPGEGQFIAGGRQRTEGPADAIPSRGPVAGMPAEDTEEESDDAGGSSPLEVVGRVNAPPDLSDVDVDPADDRPGAGVIDPADDQDTSGRAQRTDDPFAEEGERDTAEAQDGGSYLPPGDFTLVNAPPDLPDLADS